MTDENEIDLTFDIDRAEDEVVRDTIDLVESRGAAATVFASHAAPVLAGLADHPLIEVGIHPNFNALLEAESPRRGRRRRVFLNTESMARIDRADGSVTVIAGHGRLRLLDVEMGGVRGPAAVLITSTRARLA